MTVPLSGSTFTSDTALSAHFDIVDPTAVLLLLVIRPHSLPVDVFFRDPDRRWPWLAHAALVAKHRLADLPLARRYASAVQRYARGPDVPT